MGILANLKSMISDGVDGSISSKRVITVMATFLVALAFVLNLFWDLDVDANMYDSMMMIVVAGLGTTVAEKFAKK
ncbi:MAG: hypothetical protein EBY03_07580 [Actinobacteria bacterium]|jgi:hypothetical protein|nr:hypothetical protein [Actinomycetota bacterium]